METATWPRFFSSGDAAVLVEFGSSIDLATNRQVHALARRLVAAPFAGLVEAVPAYASLLVHYDPLIVEEAAVLDHLRRSAVSLNDASVSEASFRRVEIPVIYGGTYGPDLVDVAAAHRMAPEEVIRRHCAVEYVVYMVGFSPGFAYLGGLDPEIATPRLTTPRSSVPAGSVGIAGSQTGVYPNASPGGWCLIGWTPVVLFDPGRLPPALLSAGDRVRFLPMSPEEAK